MSDHAGGYVGVIVIELHFPEAGSLKAKRKDLASTKALLHSRFGASVAETEYQDLWQRSTVVAALASASARVLNETVDALIRWLDARYPNGVYVREMIASVQELVDEFTNVPRGE